MTEFENTWGIYPWFIEYIPQRYIYPQDLESFKTLSAYKKVFFCISEDSNYICLSYGQKRFRVKPDLYKQIETDGFFIKDTVEILNGSSQGKKATIENMYWHHKKQKIMYELKVNGKIKSRTYYQEDFKS